MTERKSEWLYLIIGLVIGTAWFVYNRLTDFGAFPPMADAVTYSEISNSFRSFGEAFSYAADRTFGFPFVLYCMKRLVEVFSTPTPEELDAAQTAMLLIFHFAASVFFYRSLRKTSQHYGLRIHPAALLLILIHPGLTGYTSVLLTDTFTSNLIMIATALLLGAREAGTRSLLLRGAAMGTTLGLAVAARPFLVVSTFVFFCLIATLALLFRSPKRPLLFFALTLASFSLFLLPSVLQCRTIYGKVCMQNPGFAAQGVESLKWGLTSVRTYWSSRSEYTVAPDEQTMAKNIRATCDIQGIKGGIDWLKCIFSNPFFTPVFLVKKVIGLFDSYFLHSYASDVTSSWDRRYARIFGMLSFVGYFCAIGILVGFLRRRKIWESLALSLPVLILLFQLPMHIEPRYSFSTVPICLVATVWLFQKAIQQGRRMLITYLIVFVTLGGTFLVQTHLWDLDDVVLQQIEGWYQTEK